MQKALLLLSIRDLIWQNGKKKTAKKLEKPLGKINQIIEATQLLTEKIDIKSLNQLAYAAAITVIKIAGAEN